MAGDGLRPASQRQAGAECRWAGAGRPAAARRGRARRGLAAHGAASGGLRSQEGHGPAQVAGDEGRVDPQRDASPVRTVGPRVSSWRTTSPNSGFSSRSRTSSRRKRTEAVRSGVASRAEAPQNRRKLARSSSASVTFTFDRSCQKPMSSTLSSAGGGQPGSPRPGRRDRPEPRLERAPVERRPALRPHDPHRLLHDPPSTHPCLPPPRQNELTA